MLSRLVPRGRCDPARTSHWQRRRQFSSWTKERFQPNLKAPRLPGTDTLVLSHHPGDVAPMTHNQPNRAGWDSGVEVGDDPCEKDELLPRAPHSGTGRTTATRPRSHPPGLVCSGQSFAQRLDPAAAAPLSGVWPLTSPTFHPATSLLVEGFIVFDQTRGTNDEIRLNRLLMMNEAVNQLPTINEGPGWTGRPLTSSSSRTPNERIQCIAG